MIQFDLRIFFANGLDIKKNTKQFLPRDVFLGEDDLI